MEVGRSWCRSAVDRVPKVTMIIGMVPGERAEAAKSMEISQAP